MNKLNRKLSTGQIYGSGLALILICLLIYIFADKTLFLYFSVAFTILLMVLPAPFKYFGFVWFAIGDLLGFVVSKIILSLVFVSLVIPMSLVKKRKIRKNMHLSFFKDENKDSFFKNRTHKYTNHDFEKPF